jgi:hypothetical protein
MLLRDGAKSLELFQILVDGGLRTEMAFTHPKTLLEMVCEQGEKCEELALVLLQRTDLTLTERAFRSASFTVRCKMVDCFPHFPWDQVAGYKLHLVRRKRDKEQKSAV